MKSFSRNTRWVVLLMVKIVFCSVTSLIHHCLSLAQMFPEASYLKFYDSKNVTAMHWYTNICKQIWNEWAHPKKNDLYMQIGKWMNTPQEKWPLNRSIYYSGSHYHKTTVWNRSHSRKEFRLEVLKSMVQGPQGVYKMIQWSQGRNC